MKLIWLLAAISMTSSAQSTAGLPSFTRDEIAIYRHFLQVMSLTEEKEVIARIAAKGKLVDSAKRVLSEILTGT